MTELDLPLRSVELERSAHELLQQATKLSDEVAAAEQRFQAFADHTAGLALEQGLVRAKKITNEYRQHADLITLIAHILLATAEAQAELEDYARRIRSLARALGIIIGPQRHLIAVADYALAHIPLVRTALNYIDAASNYLDTQCSIEIESLHPSCSHPLDPRGLYFAESQDLSIDDIHVQARAKLESYDFPGIAEFLDSNPHARLIEIDHDGIVVAFGDIEKAQHIETKIAGTGSSDPHSWVGRLETAAQLQRDSKGSAAIISYLNYQAPPTLSAAISKRWARRDAPAINEFLKSLRSRAPHAFLYGEGHSYGALPLAMSAQPGDDNPLDALVVLGAPGLGTASREDIHLDGPIINVEGETDIIRLVNSPTGGIHGPDPQEIADKTLTCAVSHSGYDTDEKCRADINAALGLN
ncbi:alpha/beta hydrolase family protein [Corynebacterium sp. ES2794-CONJ1]|uniref:alpha/beta hydrolase family protein n=1 Tax=Corynebacterium sp. ES2794-CONJ1 TaxID=2980553 RepID=UPI0021D83A2E|nr:alpha/beta hydrolase family protein [Corynebacterium sp. ES2794-CONJ1]MCU9519514.1 alpha/beta hydrolase family protein [Corynebacterium sp. ES2794-CONJ1]